MLDQFLFVIGVVVAAVVVVGDEDCIWYTKAAFRLNM